MAICRTCGNNYDGGMEVLIAGKAISFDSFECAIHMLAPSCESCGIRILGHGIQKDDRMFCSSHCARAQGVEGSQTHL